MKPLMFLDVLKAQEHGPDGKFVAGPGATGPTQSVIQRHKIPGSRHTVTLEHRTPGDFGSGHHDHELFGAVNTKHGGAAHGYWTPDRAEAEQRVKDLVRTHQPSRAGGALKF